MKLYTFFRSSAAYRVRIALNLKGLAYDSVPIHFRRNGGEHRSSSFLALNPQGLLPVLEVDGMPLAQSLAIIEYLDETTNADPKLLPDNALARAQVRAMAQVVACDLHPLNNLRVLAYLKTTLEQPQPAVDAWYRHWVGEGLRALEQLAQVHSAGDRHLHGDAWSLADVCLVPQMYNARRFECPLDDYPTLVSIDAHLCAQPPVVAASPEQQPDAQ